VVFIQKRYAAAQGNAVLCMYAGGVGKTRNRIPARQTYERHEV